MPDEWGPGRLSPAPHLHQHPTYPLLLSLHPGLFPSQTTLTLQASSHPASLPLFHAFSGFSFPAGWLKGSVSHTPVIRLSLAADGGWLCRMAQL